MKKSRKVRLSITAPCSEDWNNMSLVSDGRFCNSCNKVVIDFTRYSDDELYRFFSSSKANGTCGRLLSTQLEPNKVQGSGFRIAVGAVFGLVFSSWFLNTTAAVKSKNEAFEQMQPSFKKAKDHVVLTDTIGVIKGKVIDDEAKMPLPGVTVKINRLNLVVSTDAEGGFVLSSELLAIYDTIEFNYPGYKVEKINLGQINLRKEVMVEMKFDPSSLGEVIVVAGGVQRVTLWWKVKRFFGFN